MLRQTPNRESVQERNPLLREKPLPRETPSREVLDNFGRQNPIEGFVRKVQDSIPNPHPTVKFTTPSGAPGVEVGLKWRF